MALISRNTTSDPPYRLPWPSTIITSVPMRLAFALPFRVYDLSHSLGAVLAGVSRYTPAGKDSVRLELHHHNTSVKLFCAGAKPTRRVRGGAHFGNRNLRE